MNTFLIFGSSGKIASHFIEKNMKNKNNFFILVDKVKKKQVWLENKSNVVYFPIDITHSNDFKYLEEYLETKEIYIDYVLFSIGVNYANSFFSSSIREFQDTFNTNMNSLFLSLKVIYKYLSHKSSIVSIASQNGIVGHEDRIDYGPSKAAMIQFAKNFSVDTAINNEKDIKFNTISPGYIISNDSNELFNSVKGKKMKQKIPYKKLVELEDITNVIEFLFSDKSTAIRGQNIVVDYGYTIV